MLQLEDIRSMGDNFTKARVLCQESRYEQGIPLFEETLDRLRGILVRMTKLSERQPWLQVQNELERELGLIVEYTETLQVFKYSKDRLQLEQQQQQQQQQQQRGYSASSFSSSSSAAAATGALAHSNQEKTSPKWQVYIPARQTANTDNNQASTSAPDPDVWAPPSPQKATFNGGSRAAPSWADTSESSANNTKGRVIIKHAAKSRKSPHEEQPQRRAHGTVDKKIKAKESTRDSKDTSGLRAAREKTKSTSSNTTTANTSNNNSDTKTKYSDLARDEGWCDLELIETIERDIVDNAAKISFDQIAGLEHTKQLLQEAVMLPQIAPHLFKDGRLKPCNGVLMFGPPGTGKTLLAKAVANVCNTTFFNVSASTLASKYRGESEKMVRILFDMARFYAPSIIFMDEIDAIAGARGSAQEHESSRRVKTELLVQINGVSSGDPADPKNRVMVLAATNLPWELDEAMRRRLTKRVYIPLPDVAGRRQLFKINLEKTEVAPQVDFDKLVEHTQGYSCDDICGLCEAAKMMPVKRLYTPQRLIELHRKKQEGANTQELVANDPNAMVITWEDFQTALANVSKSVSQEQLERFVKWEEEFGSK